MNTGLYKSVIICGKISNIKFIMICMHEAKKNTESNLGLNPGPSDEFSFVSNSLMPEYHNECTRSAEPSPQVWFGKQERFSRWQENNCRWYLTIITIIILRLYYICVCVCVTTYTQVLLRVHNSNIKSTVLKSRRNCKTVCDFNHVDKMS